MKDIYKSKKQLIKELEDLRRKASQGTTGTLEAPPVRTTDDLVSDGPNYRSDRGSLLLIRQAIDSATDAIALSDPEGHHVYQNKAFTNLFEYTAEELAAVGNEAAFTVKSIAREIFGSIMSGRSWSGEVEMISKSGRVVGLFLRADAIKDDSGRIVGLVGVFTDIAERKRLEYQLRKKNDELQLILDSMPAYVFYKDKDGKMININKAAMALAYAPKEKLLQKTVFDLMPETADKYNRDDMEVIRSGQPKTNIEESLELPSGIRWLKTDKLPIKDDEGNTVGLLGFSVDITDRKKSQEELHEKEALLRSFFNSPGLVCGVVELEGNDIRYITVNAAMSEMYGLTPEAVSNKLASEIGTDRGIVELFIKNYKKSSESNAPAYFEYQRSVGQETRWFYVTATFLGLEAVSRKPRYAFITTDITERRKMEEALRESEAKYRFLAERMNDIIWTVDMSFKSTYVSPSHTKILGYTPEERVGQLGQNFVTEESFKRCVEALACELERDGKEGVDPDRSLKLEIEYYHKDGSTVWMEDMVTAIRDNKGKPIGLQGVSRDITERKKAERALQESEQKLRLTFASMADGVVVTDTEGKITDINEAQLRMFGFKEKSELIGRGGFDFLAVRERGRALADMFGVYEKGFNPGSAYIVVDKNDREFECELSTAMLHDATGKPSGTVTVMRDVTERRRLEQTVRESEERYRLLAENVSDVIWTMDLNLNFTYISPSVLSVRGYPAEEAVKMPLKETVTPDSMSTVMQVLKEEFEVDHTDQYTSRTIEVELKCKNGSTVWTEMKLSWLHDTGGNRIGIMGVTRDITERKKAGEALRETSEKLRVIFDSIGEAVTVVDLNGDIVDANKEALRLHGFKSKEELVGKRSTDMVAPIDRERAVDDAIKSLKSPYPTERKEYKLIDTSGREFDGEFNVAALRDNKEKPAGFIGIARDISDRKLMEDELRRSEEFFKEITENASDVIVITDKDGVIKYCSRSTERFTGYRPEEMVGSSAFKFIHADDVQRAVADYDKAIQMKDTAIPNAFRIVHKDGSDRFFDGLGKNLLDNPAIEGFVMNIRDVTDRNKIEEALRNSEEKLRVMFDSMMDGIVVSDQNVKIVDVNKAALELIGTLTREELLGRNAMDVIRFKDREAAVANLTRMFKEQRPQEKVEYSLILPGGRELEAEVSTAMMLDSAGKVVGFVNAIRDITERKIWENTLRESEEKYRNLVERERDVIVSVDALGFVKSANSAVKMWGYTVDEMLKMNFLELIAPEWREVTATQLQTRLLDAGENIGETMVVRKDGEQRPIEYSAVVIQEGGKYAGAQAIVRDISERKKSEEALQAKERYFRAITDLSSGAALVVSSDGNIADVTGGLERISGHTREGTLGRSALEFIHPDDLEKSGAAFNEVLRNPGKTVTFEARLKNAQGKWQWTESMLTNLLEHHDVRGIVNHLVDITERKKTEEDIKRHASRVEALYGVAQVISQSSTLDTMLKDTLGKVCAAMDTESGCIFMLDLDEKALKLKTVQGVSEGAIQQFSTIALTDEGIERIMGLSGPVTEIDAPHTVADVENVEKLTTELGRRSIAAIPFYRGKDMQGLIVTFSTAERTFSNEDLELLSAIANEISIGINNIMLLEKTREMSMSDELTGLYNRRYFFEMLDVEINRAGRTKNPFSLVMLDLDGFKEYNDKYGHSNGDAVLETFSRILKSSIRKSDMAFRYGGDEFALILPSADAEKAKQIVQRARAKWQKATLSQSRIFGGNVGFSTGIAEYPENAESADGLIFLADAALYQAKKNGYEDKIVSELRTLSTDIMDVATQDQVYALAATVDARDPYTYGHSQRVAEIAMLIGKAVGLSSEDLDKLQAAALLHDIGKVGVPDAILTKMGKPTPEEWDVIKKHCSEGARIVSYVKELASLVPIILHHHEWYDGSGYPGGLKGMDIPSGARITTVADSYDTMVTKRPYREVISPSEACEELKRKAGTQFDPIIVDVWCKFVARERKKGK